MSAEVRTIHLRDEAALDGLRRRVQAALDGWSRDWVGPPPPGRQAHTYICIAAAGRTPPEPGTYEVLQTSAGRCWVRRSPDDRLRFDRLLLGAGGMRVDEWITAAAAAAWQARDQALCAALFDVPIAEPVIAAAGSPPRALVRFGSGAVHVACDELGLFAFADAGVWRSSKAHAAAHGLPLTPLDRAAQRSRVELQVVLGSVELDVPKLLDLRCGDVLRLPQRLDQKVTVTCNDRALARAQLGAMQGRKCVQVFTHES